MASLKDIRDRIKSVKSIQKVTSAMKMVSAAKVRKAQEKMDQARPYTSALEDVIHHILPDIDRADLDLLQIRCLLYTSPSPRDGTSSRMPSSA